MIEWAQYACEQYFLEEYDGQVMYMSVGDVYMSVGDVYMSVGDVYMRK